jgi:molybdate transport system substrate-binding protein
MERRRYGAVLAKAAMCWVASALLLTWAGTADAQPGGVPLGGKAAEGSKERIVRVAAAADLKFALDEILVGFHAQHPDIKVQVSYGSSGNFFAQLTNRAPFDLYFSADVAYPRKLIERGLTATGTPFLYAIGRIVVWVPRHSPIAVEHLGIHALLAPGVRKIAIANPKHAPYGRAAEAAMQALGVYSQVQERLVLGENIAQTAQFIQTGAAEIGIIALSLALAPVMKGEGRYWEVPLDAYPRIEQGGVILAWAMDAAAAQTLQDFVLGPDGKAVLRRYGFFLPGE